MICLIGNDILGFDSSGAVVNKPDTHGGHLDWKKICEDSAKVGEVTRFLYEFIFTFIAKQC